MTNFEKDKLGLEKIGVTVIDKIPNNILEGLNNQSKQRQFLKPHNKHLAGHIQTESELVIWPEYNEYIIDEIVKSDMCREILERTTVVTKPLPLIVENSWINFQKKFEFNPIHTHSGLFSFIIFLKIPYDLQKEDQVYPGLENSSNKQKYATSRLSFMVIDCLGSISEFRCNVDKSYENKMLLFSAKMPHTVYPFYTSDEERITVSGNIRLDNGGKKGIDY